MSFSACFLVPVIAVLLATACLGASGDCLSSIATFRHFCHHTEHAASTSDTYWFLALSCITTPRTLLRGLPEGEGNPELPTTTHSPPTSPEGRPTKKRGRQ